MPWLVIATFASCQRRTGRVAFELRSTQDHSSVETC